MILITGASGKTGRAVIQALARQGELVRAFVRQEGQVKNALASGAAEAFLGDLYDPISVSKAADGCQAMYHICPNMNPDEQLLGEIGIAAAKSSGVGRFVYHSVLHPQVQEMPHHWNKLLVEERLFKSGLSYTILQPAAYMQNTLAQWPAVMEGVYAVPYSPQTRLGMVDLNDVAEVAAKTLTEPSHAGATYELAGSETLSQAEVAAVFAAEIGHPVRAEAIPLDVWEARVRAGGLNTYSVETLRKMFQYYEEHNFWGNARVLTGLLGRQPVTFAEFVRRTVAVS